MTAENDRFVIEQLTSLIAVHKETIQYLMESNRSLQHQMVMEHCGEWKPKYYEAEGIRKMLADVPKTKVNGLPDHVVYVSDIKKYLAKRLADEE